MKEATGELNMTVIAIIIIVALGAIVMALLGEGGPVSGWMKDRFERELTRDTLTK